MSKTCRYYCQKGKKKGERCKSKVSSVDPEGYFCTRHKRCVYPTKYKQRQIAVNVAKPTIKYHDFITLKVSCIEFVSQSPNGDCNYDYQTTYDLTCDPKVSGI